MTEQHHVIKCDGNHLWTVKNVNTGDLETLPYKDIQALGTWNYLFPTTDGKWLRVKNSKRIPSEPVRCIKVDNLKHLYEIQDGKHRILSHNTGGGKSILQRNIVFHVITHSKEIKFLGIDLKRVELSTYKKYSDAVLGIATTLEDAVEILRFAQETMMNRYAEMEQAGKQNFLEMENAGSALLIMIDEAGELLDTSAPAKALVGSTIIPNVEGREDLAHIAIGDHVIGEDGKPAEVKDKYEPVSQDRFSLTFRRTSDGAKESFIAGAEHWWTVYVNGDERLLTTKELNDLYLATPVNDRKKITFKRAKHTMVTN
jgi:hypothetical protein